MSNNNRLAFPKNHILGRKTITKKVPTDVLSGAKPADLEKNKNLEQPTPKVARKSMEANKKTNTEPTQHQMAGSKRGEIDKNKNIEQPTPVILRKTQEDKNKVDQATPKLVRKSLESKKATNEPLPSPQLPGSKRFEYDKNKNLEQGTPKVARKSMEKDVPTTDVGKKSKESRDKKAHSLEIAAPPDAKRKSSEDKKLESGSTLVKKSTEKPDKKDPPTPSHRKKLLDTAKTPDDRKEAPSARPKKSMEKGTPQTPIRRLKNRGDKSQEGDKEVNDTVPSSTKKSVRTNKTPPLEREKSKKD
uniref:Uncharacterized protein n=2 Tax=Caenorhabditis japonica TaxID=281687 RepID=A0A8R1IYU4_CAEJA